MRAEDRKNMGTHAKSKRHIGRGGLLLLSVQGQGSTEASLSLAWASLRYQPKFEPFGLLSPAFPSVYHDTVRHHQASRGEYKHLLIQV